MNENWPTKIKDMLIAQLIMEQYAISIQVESLGLFELFFNQNEKCMNFKLAIWVVALLDQFNMMYGIQKGEVITRQVISCCLTCGQTIH